MNKNDLITEARERFKQSEEADAKFRSEAQEDLKFLSGDQWNEKARSEREDTGRPCLTINRLPTFIRQITNEGRQNRPAIQVDPTGHGATSVKAQTMSGLIRHIEYDSSADTAYDTAAWYAAVIGVGYFRVIPQYESSFSFDQKLTIKAIPNPLSVFPDPNAKEADGSDLDWAFIVDELSTDEYERLYPESETTGLAKAKGWGELTIQGWISKDTVRIAEYYYKEYVTETIVQVYNTFTGSTQIEKESDEGIKEGIADGSLRVLNTRKVLVPIVKWAKFNGVELLEETTFPGEYIPVIPVKGEEFWVGGERFLSGAIRHAKDAQKSLNFHTSLQTEMVDLAPKAPWVGAKGQFEGREHQWQNANSTAFGYLEYDPIEINGTLLPAPTRQNVETPIQAISLTRQQAQEDMKAVFGIYDSSLGAQSNEVSGKAILARKSQSNNANFHYYDNLTRSIKHLGRILVTAIPEYYDTQRAIRIVKPNGDQEVKELNTPQEDGDVLDFAGKYDVVIKTGPSYASQREEAVSSMIALGEAVPEMLPLFADLAVGEMQWPMAKEVAARLRTQVPQEILEATGEQEDGVKPEQKVAQQAMAIKQMSEQLKAMNQYAQDCEQKLKMADEENKLLKLKSDVEIAKAEMDKAIKERELTNQEQTTMMEYQIKTKELELAERQLDLKEAEMGIRAASAASAVEATMYDRSTKHLDTNITGLDHVDLGGEL
jgi:hypothetical protein